MAGIKTDDTWVSPYSWGVGDDGQLLPLPSALYEGGLLCWGQLVPVLTLWQELGGEDYIGNGMIH